MASPHPALRSPPGHHARGPRAGVGPVPHPPIRQLHRHLHLRRHGPRGPRVDRAARPLLGIRDHGRCPLWLWWQIQLDDGFLGVWHWELPNGALVYRDGCWAGADMSEPVPVVDFRYDAKWVGADGNPAAYGEHGDTVAGVVASAAFTLADRRMIEVEAGGSVARTLRT